MHITTFRASYTMSDPDKYEASLRYIQSSLIATRHLEVKYIFVGRGKRGVGITKSA